MILALVMAHWCLYGQTDDSTRRAMSSKGLSVQAGVGSYALRDEFISRETYSALYLCT